MKKLLFLFIPALLVSCVAKESNTENPRGVYKMTKLIGKMGEIAAPFDQYQICTDSITMLAWMESDGRLYINGTYENVLNYTGENLENSTDRSIRVYDSNSKGFALKWWSEYDNHIYFPKSDWCTELYETDLYSDYAKPFFDLLMNPQNTRGDKDSYLGTWRIAERYFQIEKATYTSKGIQNKSIDEILKELKDDESLLKSITDSTETHPKFITFGPAELLEFNATASNRGHLAISHVKYNTNNSYANRGTAQQVIWLSENCIASLSNSNREMRDLLILVRKNTNESLISKIADYYITE